MVHRRLTRSADHQASLLRNLITSLFEHESIVTTHAKAKEAQTYAERVITKARALTEKQLSGGERRQALHAQIAPLIHKQEKVLPKLMDELTVRYKSFNGGYTRVLKLENRLGDNAPQSILELVGGTRDMRRAMLARTVARYEAEGVELTPVTQLNIRKVCRDADATQRFRDEVAEMRDAFYSPEQLARLPPLPKPWAAQNTRRLETRSNPLVPAQPTTTAEPATETSTQ